MWSFSPNASPQHPLHCPISKLSWTCFDPSFINNLIVPALANYLDSAHPSPQLLSLLLSKARRTRSAPVTLPPLFAREVQIQMSTQPPNSQLMGRTNVAMAVAQPKPKPAPKANATPKGKMQMHRRSRTGMLDFQLYLVLPFSQLELTY